MAKPNVNSPVVNPDFKGLAECSNFSHLILFNKKPLSIGGQLLHIPTDSYKYDLYFRLIDANTVKVSWWRYYSSDYYSEQKDSFLISVADYVANIGLVDTTLSEAKTYNYQEYGCIWLTQSAAHTVFKKYRAFEIGSPVQQQDLFA